MERTVPSTASEEIELYLRTIYSLLRSTTEVQVRTLEEVHAGTNSSLHPDARGHRPDPSAFIYSLLRLPDCMPQVHTVVLGQSRPVFEARGFDNVENWEPVSARARRRRCYYDGKGTLACFVASRSDIDDVIPTLTAYQIEWNKLHDLLQEVPPQRLEKAAAGHGVEVKLLAAQLDMVIEDLERLMQIWGSQFVGRMQQIAAERCSLRVLLISGSLADYWRATRTWWDNIEQASPQLLDRPVYFVSSNTHSLTNLLTGFARQRQDELIAYLEHADNASLAAEWQEIRGRNDPTLVGNFLYYLMKKYQQTPQGHHLLEEQAAHEQNLGVTRIPSIHSFDVDAQVIEMSRLDPAMIDPRLGECDCDFLRRSDAMIFNIDYPLGLAAYNILAKVAEHAGNIQGVYVLGKAATLNGVRGDVMIPNVVQDEHSHNTYLFQNVFSAAAVAPYLLYGTVLDYQKAVSVLGTFLQNARIMDVVYREGYTDIEMESGPYLSAVYEMYRPQRHPVDEIVNLYGVPFDIGVLHYASDTPLSKGKNLGAGTLSYFGMDSTYATTVAILRRILKKERERIGN